MNEVLELQETDIEMDTVSPVLNTDGSGVSYNC
jgi:hypothetical protein